MADRGDDDTTASAESPLTLAGLESSRRDVLRGALAGGAILATGGLAAACGGSAPTPTTKRSPHGMKPRRGGSLRVGIMAGSTP